MMATMAKRLEDFSFTGQQARYDWSSWTDGSAWEIRQGEDYEIPTENMRVNLFMKAKQRGVKVRTRIVRDENGEGLRFQFYEPSVDANESDELAAVEHLANTAEGADTSDVVSLEDRWHAEMVDIYAAAKDIDYIASGFIQMVHRDGGLTAARKPISADQPSDGFTRLWELGRLDISVEARALKPEYRDLFSQLELKRCRDRLAAYEWTATKPWEPPTRTRSRS
jgi:hypothetical protein